MKQTIERKKKLASDWFKYIQEKIINEFQLLENEMEKKDKIKKKYFIKKKWKKDNKIFLL